MRTQKPVADCKCFACGGKRSRPGLTLDTLYVKDVRQELDRPEMRNSFGRITGRALGRMSFSVLLVCRDCGSTCHVENTDALETDDTTASFIERVIASIDAATPEQRAAAAQLEQSARTVREEANRLEARAKRLRNGET